MWLRFLCLTCGINEAPPTELDGKSPQRALAHGTSDSPPASTSCPALETCDTVAAATTALPSATLATLTPPYVRRHQRTITLDGSEGSFISVGVPAADCFGNEAADPGRSDGGGAGSPSHASALAAGSAAGGGTARISRNSPALPGHHGHRRGAVTAGGGLGGGGGGAGGGGATCSPPSWARRPGSAKALAYGSGGGAATASASMPAVPSRFSLNGASPVLRSAYGYTGAPTTTATTADCGSISTGSMCGGVGCGGGYGGRMAGGGITDGGCPPSQQPQLQRPSGGGGRLHRRYYAPATPGADAAAGAAAAATAADCAAAGTAVRLAGWPGSADDAAQGAAAASSALQQAATAAACRHVAKAHATDDAADAGADADDSSAHQAVAAAAAAVAGVEAGGDTAANEADAEDNSSIDSAATVVLVEREAEAGGAAATAGEFGMGPTTQLPWGPNAAQRTLLPSHPQQLLRYAPLPPLQGPRFLLPSAAGPAAAANSARPWRSCKDSDAAASAPASGAQRPLAAFGTGGERGAATAVAGPVAEPAKAVVVATVDCKEQPWEQDRAAALQQQCRELLQQFPPPLPFAPSSSKLLMKEACPPRRTVTGSSFGSCNNSISLRVDLSGNGGLGILVGERDDDVGDDRGVAEGAAAACGSAPHGVVFATRMGAAVVA